MEINETTLQSKIYLVRGQKVMLDFDLAEIYGYETKNFNRQVKNNKAKFEGEDFMFQLTDEEVARLSRCKNFTLNRGTGRGTNVKYNPSSKDAGGRITSILEDPDRMKYDSMIKDLLKNNQLVLK